ncbi:MAG: tRNA-specific 2-thiouridylase [Chloroflexi bacterium]|nr:MAG: tRNA-specific 2-thiouridylase [Chloroflexota bacterium]
MSGGVDSSVAAALLVEQEYDVVGMMLKLWTGECELEANACCTPESIGEARSVAVALNIPFYVIDAKDIFKQHVVDQFISSYQRGLTPNPCFICNQTVKWEYLLSKANQIGADYLATGHYAQIIEDEVHVYHLLKGIDEQKDQSYILAGLTQKKLCRTLLPLGKLKKNDVREIAVRYCFNVARKPDSQDLCFTGKSGYRAFLATYGSQEKSPGVIRNVAGETVGEHQGLASYTIGQRKGLGSGYKVPQYVISKNIDLNELVIGTEDQLGSKSFQVSQINWISGFAPTHPKEYWVKIRYKANPVLCSVEDINADALNIVVENKIRDATPGQIAVFYDDNEVIGSGVIISTEGE